MNFIIKIIIFAFFINLASGIVINLFPGTFDDSGLQGLKYRENASQEFVNTMNGSINPQENMEDASDKFDRLLDKLTIGVWSKLAGAINQYFYGFITLMHDVIGPHLEPDIRQMLFGRNGKFGMVGTIFSLGYVFFAISLWTGRKVNQ